MLLQQARSFRAEAKYYDMVAYEGSTNRLQEALSELFRLDVRIMVGFFGAEEARVVLCEVGVLQMHSYNYMCSFHVHTTMGFN